MVHRVATNDTAFVRTVSRGCEGWGNISSMNMTMGNVELDIHDPGSGCTVD